MAIGITATVKCKDNLFYVSHWVACVGWWLEVCCPCYYIGYTCTWANWLYRNVPSLICDNTFRLLWVVRVIKLFSV